VWPPRKERYPISVVVLDPPKAAWSTVSAGRPAEWPLRTLLVGDTGREELRECVAQIRQRTHATDAATEDDALAAAANGRPPDLIVIATARPGEFSHAAVEALRRSAPLARIVGLLGSWCEGESRSGHPWPAVPRIYWHGWSAWFERELATLADGRCGTLSLPLTATDEERLLHVGASWHAEARGVIGIYSREREAAAMLAAACRSFGYDVQRLDSLNDSATGPWAAAIWDTSTPDQNCCEELRTLTGRWPDAPWIAIASFPREEDIKRAQSCGAQTIVAKPFVLDDLHAALRRLVAERRADAGGASADAAG